MINKKAAFLAVLLSASVHAHQAFESPLLCELSADPSATISPEKFFANLVIVYNHAGVGLDELKVMAQSRKLFDLPFEDSERRTERVRARVLLKNFASIAQKLSLEDAMPALLSAHIAQKRLQDKVQDSSQKDVEQAAPTHLIFGGDLSKRSMNLSQGGVEFLPNSRVLYVSQAAVNKSSLWDFSNQFRSTHLKPVYEIWDHKFSALLKGQNSLLVQRATHIEVFRPQAGAEWSTAAKAPWLTLLHQVHLSVDETSGRFASFEFNTGEISIWDIEDLQKKHDAGLAPSPLGVLPLKYPQERKVLEMGNGSIAVLDAEKLTGDHRQEGEIEVFALSDAHFGKRIFLGRTRKAAPYLGRGVYQEDGKSFLLSQSDAQSIWSVRNADQGEEAIRLVSFPVVNSMPTSSHLGGYSVGSKGEVWIPSLVNPSIKRPFMEKDSPFQPGLMSDGTFMSPDGRWFVSRTGRKMFVWDLNHMRASSVDRSLPHYEFEGSFTASFDASGRWLFFKNERGEEAWVADLNKLPIANDQTQQIDSRKFLHIGSSLKPFENFEWLGSSLVRRAATDTVERRIYSAESFESEETLSSQDITVDQAMKISGNLMRISADGSRYLEISRDAAHVYDVDAYRGR